MIYSETHNFLFVSNPKTGTHTMYDYLPKHYDGVRVGGFHERVVPKEYEGLFTFTTIRNPFERTVAAWNSLLFQPDYRSIYLEKIGSDSFPAFVDWLTSHDNLSLFKGKGSPVLCLQSVWLEPAMSHIEFYVPTSMMNTAFSMLRFARGNDVFVPKLKREHRFYHNDLENELRYSQACKLREWLQPDLDLYYGVLEDIKDILE
jgi:hypothetical protein